MSKEKQNWLNDDDPVPAADDLKGIQKSLRGSLRHVDLTTGGAEGDLGALATAAAQGTAEGAGDWETQRGVPCTGDVGPEVDEGAHPDLLQVMQQSEESDDLDETGERYLPESN